jgi:hypothetical protein
MCLLLRAPLDASSSAPGRPWWRGEVVGDGVIGLIWRWQELSVSLVLWRGTRWPVAGDLSSDPWWILSGVCLRLRFSIRRLGVVSAREDGPLASLAGRGGGGGGCGGVLLASFRPVQPWMRGGRRCQAVGLLSLLTAQYWLQPALSLSRLLKPPWWWLAFGVCLMAAATSSWSFSPILSGVGLYGSRAAAPPLLCSGKRCSSAPRLQVMRPRR